MTARIESFGEAPDGTPVKRVSISRGSLTAHVLTYGATVQDLRLDGVDHPLVLGSPALDAYFGPMTYFGAIVGRFANRIAGGRFDVDGHTYAVPANWLGRHALHGGSVGTGQRVWSIGEVERDRLRLDLVLADGEMGFPGRMEVSASFTMCGDDVLAIVISAKSDAATPCSFAHHGYFNLDGSADITDHHLWIGADAYLPVDHELIPTGEIAPIAETAFDFRRPRAVGRDALDHNFCLSDGQEPLRPIARLHSPRSGIAMTVASTEPGLQIYSGAYMLDEGLQGLGGRRYGPFGGIAMETQGWPDAPNRPHFPSALLRPGATYRHEVRYDFEQEGV